MLNCELLIMEKKNNYFLINMYEYILNNILNKGINNKSLF